MLDIALNQSRNYVRNHFHIAVLNFALADFARFLEVSCLGIFGILRRILNLEAMGSDFILLLPVCRHDLDLFAKLVATGGIEHVLCKGRKDLWWWKGDVYACLLPRVYQGLIAVHAATRVPCPSAWALVETTRCLCADNPTYIGPVALNYIGAL